MRSSGISKPSHTARARATPVQPAAPGQASTSELPSLAGRQRYVAGADIGGTRVRMMLADLSGAPVARWSTVMNRQHKTPIGICQLIHRGLHEMCAANKISLRNVLYLTAGAPGITNVATGTVLSAPNLDGWNDVPLRRLLEDETGVRVSAENDVNLAALGEHRSGAARGVDNFIFVALGTGVGAGIFLRGAIHHGAQWTAGEIGYIGVRQMEPEPIRMQETGQLERRIGGEGVERYWRELLKAQADTDPALLKLHAPAIFDRAQGGDPIALEVLTDTAQALAEAIATMSLLLNPELVVLGGGVGAHAELARVTQSLLARHEFANPQIRPSVLGTDAQLFGAVALSLQAAGTSPVP